MVGRKQKSLAQDSPTGARDDNVGRALVVAARVVALVGGHVAARARSGRLRDSRRTGEGGERDESERDLHDVWVV